MIVVRPERRRSAQEICDQGNAAIVKVGRKDIRWFVRNGDAVLDWVRPPIRDEHRAR
jgi:hypothetical protein